MAPILADIGMKMVRDARRRRAAVERTRVRQDVQAARQAQTAALRATRERAAVASEQEWEAFQERRFEGLDVHPSVDWREIACRAPPSAPARSSRRETNARAALETFKPKFSDRVLRRTQRRIDALRDAVRHAALEDQDEWLGAVRRHEAEFAAFRQKQQLAKRIVKRDPGVALEAIEATLARAGVKDLFPSVWEIFTNDGVAAVQVHLRAEDLVPVAPARILRNGRTSSRTIPTKVACRMQQERMAALVLQISRAITTSLPGLRFKIAVMAETQNSKGDREVLRVATAEPTRAKVMAVSHGGTPEDLLTALDARFRFLKTRPFEAV